MAFSCHTGRVMGRAARGAILATLCGATALPALFLLPAVSLPGQARAQDAGVTLGFDVSTELRHNDNLGLDVDSPGSANLWDTGLGFRFGSVTRNSALTLDGSGTLRAADLPDSRETGFEDPLLRFGYHRNSASARLGLTASWRETDLRFSDPLSEPILLEDEATGESRLRQETGSRQRRSAGVTLETGIDGPVGTTFGVSRRETLYDGTNDPDRYDTMTDSANASLRLRLTPTTTGTLTGQASAYEAENAQETHRDSTSLSFGLSHELARSLVLNGNIGLREIETEKTDLGTGLRETETTSGTTYGFGATQQLQNGTIGVNYGHSVATSGDRNTLSFSRSLQPFEGNSFTGSLGLSQGDAGKTAMVADLSWSRDLSRGGWSLGVSRSVSTNDDEQDILLTQANFSFTRDLNAANALSLGLTLGMTENEDDDRDNAERASLTLAWQHELAQDARLTLGYQHRRLDEEDAEGTASSNAVYLRLGKSFNFRP